MAKLIAHQNNERISDAAYELINEKFAEVKELYIAEQHLSERAAEDYLDSFTFEEKVLEIIKYQDIELSCTMTTLKHLNNKAHS